MCLMTERKVRAINHINPEFSAAYFVVRGNVTGREMYVRTLKAEITDDEMLPLRPLYRIKVRPKHQPFPGSLQLAGSY